MRHTRLFLITCFISSLTPLISTRASWNDKSTPFPGWPDLIPGKTLTELPLQSQEKEYVKSFPGRIGRFTDGDVEYVIRWVTKATRKLHPAADCFRGSGYQVQPLPLEVDPDGTSWGCFKAWNEQLIILVQERIIETGGRSWTDVSAWYWAALMGKTSGPWWAVTRTKNFPLVDLSLSSQ